jgi:hypothetical protein
VAMFAAIRLASSIVSALAIPASRGSAGHHGGHHRGHWYHGRYWGYGIGSCWRWTPYGYVWICGY